MGKQSKTQWDFGELFPTEQTRRVLSVSELTTQVKRLLEKQIGSLWVSGEITNLRAQSSGHIYFTLKDAASQLSCVLFRSESVPHRDLLQDGQKVLVQGDVTVYEARGQYIPTWPRDMLWSDWLPVTTPDVRMSLVDFEAAVTNAVDTELRRVNERLNRYQTIIDQVLANTAASGQ